MQHVAMPDGSWRRLKVFGGMVYGGKHVTYQHGARVLAAATSKEKAADLLRRAGYFVSTYSMKGFFCETGNADELAIACEPGVWVHVGKDYEKTFLRVL